MVMATTAEVITVVGSSTKALGVTENSMAVKDFAVTVESTVETASMEVIVDFMAVKASVTADADFTGAMAGFTAAATEEAMDSMEAVVMEAGIANQKFA